MEQVQVLDKVFGITIPEQAINKAVLAVAENINADYAGKEIVFLSILNGSFMFASDLMKNITVPCRITFLKLASYVGIQSTGKVIELVGLTENLENQHVIVIEDIVDTGNTMEQIFETLNQHHPASIKVATAILKPDAYTKQFAIDYVGMELPNDFIVGYGLDYNGYGRNLKNIYTLIK